MNLGQLRTALQQRGYATDTATPQTELINSVYRRVCGMRRWPFLAASGTITMTAGTGIYDVDVAAGIGRTLLVVNAVRIEFGTGYPEISYLPEQEFRDLQHADRNRGVPLYWTLIDDDLNFWPLPDANYVITVDFTLDPTDLTADGDTPVLPAAFHDILVWGAIKELAFRERDWGARAVALEEYNARLADMMHTFGVKQRQTSTQVKDWREPGAVYYSDWF